VCFGGTSPNRSRTGRDIVELDMRSFSEIPDALPITALETATVQDDFPERLAAVRAAH
jgi:hypothetical protein